jgi:hypothetical protein
VENSRGTYRKWQYEWLYWYDKESDYSPLQNDYEKWALILIILLINEVLLMKITILLITINMLTDDVNTLIEMN